MPVKCQACGAPQENQLTENCIFCSSVISNELPAEVAVLSQFSLAVFEYQRQNLEKALNLFEQMLVSNPENAIAWVYKINCEIRLNTPGQTQFDELECSVNWLCTKFKGLNIDSFIEATILESIHYLLQLKVRRPIAGVNNRNIEGFLESANSFTENSKDYGFFRVIGRIADLFSSYFSVQFLEYLKSYVEGNKDYNFSPEQRSISMVVQVPFQLFDLRTLFRKSDINATDYFINLIALIRDCDEEEDFTKVLFLDSWIKIDMPGWYFNQKELEDIEMLNIDYNKISEFARAAMGRNEEKVNSDSVIIEKQPKKGCFIATAAMGDYNHPVVIDLRLFRNNWLLKRKWGVKFTNWYYTHGPKAARVIEKSLVLKKLTFIIIVKPIQLLTKILK
jgi:hypothetical protein